MNVITEHLGETILTVITIGLLLVLLFGTNKDGFLYNIQSESTETDLDYATFVDDDELDQVLSSTPPVIAFRDTLEEGIKNKVVKGVTYHLSDLFYAEDEQGTFLTITVKDVVAQSTGKSILKIIDETTGQENTLQEVQAFVFPTSGIYEVSMTATDKNAITSKKTICIPVAEN